MSKQPPPGIPDPITGAYTPTIRILIAWQPGHGQDVITTAAWMGRSLPVRLRAISTISRLWPTSLSKLSGGYRNWLTKETKSYQRTVQKTFTDAGINPRAWDDAVGVVADGVSEATLLVDAIAEYRPDILVIGSHSTAPKGRFFAGSTADALLHYSPIPLLLAPRGVKLAKRGITRVNMAYLDALDEEETHSLYYAGELAHRLGLPLRLLAFSPSGLTTGALEERVDISQALSAEWNERALSMLDRARDRIHDHLPDLPVTTELGSGAGWAGAVDALKWKKGDLLCIGSSPQGPLERVFLGSTAAQFLRHVPVPVVVHPVRGA